MAKVKIESRNRTVLTAFIAGLNFCNDSAIEIVDVEDHCAILEDEDHDDPGATYLLTDSGKLQLKHMGVDL